jgi:hypothetical protein
MRRRMAQHDATAAAFDQGVGHLPKQSDFRQGEGPAAGRANAERGGSLREMGGVGFLLSRADELKLSDAQQKNLHQLRVPFELEKIDKMAALQKAKVVFRALVRNPDAPEQEVLAAIDTIAECEANLRKMRYHHLKKAQAQLSAEQRHGVAQRALHVVPAGDDERS